MTDPFEEIETCSIFHSIPLLATLTTSKFVKVRVSASHVKRERSEMGARRVHQKDRALFRAFLSSGRLNPTFTTERDCPVLESPTEETFAGTSCFGNPELKPLDSDTRVLALWEFSGRR